jgi:hypothetical protein
MDQYLKSTCCKRDLKQQLCLHCIRPFLLRQAMTGGSNSVESARVCKTLIAGARDVSQLIAALRALVRHEGRWHAQHCGGYRVVAVDTTGFFRPPLRDCATKHFLSQAGEALPAIPFGLIASVGNVVDSCYFVPLAFS